MNKIYITGKQAMKEIKAMKKYDLAKLNSIANRSGINLTTISFWYNAINM